MIDEVTADRFRIRHFGKTPNGIYNGKLGTLARPVSGTEYEISVSDFLLGEWTFGHLLGNMVGEDNDPVSFYKHFVDQWDHNQTVNGWPAESRAHNDRGLTGRNDPNLTLANLPYRLLAIGNRIDLFKAESIHNISDAGEGRFVFVNTSTVNLPVDENETEQFWKIHEQSNISDNEYVYPDF